MPAVSFLNVFESHLNGKLILTTVGFLYCRASFWVITSGISRIFKFDKGISAIFKNSVVLMNSGNFGRPVSQLVFQITRSGHPFKLL
jgi:malate permease and related proteins